ncbi:hypothetical protein B2G71_03190 [Novosphingobium sp. PC22D]|uniref:hypothetical protein n=1 Tax=Novosphingobium sp. PC22D TaxID=1962403 RepID=UPI000BF0078A|nr:hypothetical protein [Novosphingobium sp. PC22D]PEQ14587.1 hypothetical protein B2G71_03190 [Novosphingobium sp. PC22D]
MMNIGNAAAVGKVLADLALTGPGPAAPAKGGIQISQSDLAKLAPMLQKAAYILALHNAIAKASSSQSFNLETQKNDLWLKLNNLTPQKIRSADLSEMMNQQQQMMTMLTQVVQKMSESSKGVIRAIGR